MTENEETAEFELPQEAAAPARTWSTRTLAAAAVAALVVGAGGGAALGAASNGGDSRGGPGNFHRMNGEGGFPGMGQGQGQQNRPGPGQGLPPGMNGPQGSMPAPPTVRKGEAGPTDQSS